MAAKVAVIGSKGGKRRTLSLLCLLTAQVLAITILAQCGDGDIVMAMRDAVTRP